MRSRVEFFAICARRGGLAFASALAAGWLAACTFGPAAPPQPPAPVTTAQPAVIVAQGSAIP
ncbi:MAG: hypothetical protein JWR68_1002, partial [Polaromonas sp.]|nr:hypothetical protein [Polaromonas sp.]